MKAIAVVPGRPNSVHLAELAKPSLSDIPGGRGILVKVLRVGVDGTDKEINAAEYGAAPNGYGFLVIGHEGFGQVEAVGPNVSFVRPGDFVVATVRRPGHEHLRRHRPAGHDDRHRVLRARHQPAARLSDRVLRRGRRVRRQDPAGARRTSACCSSR